jgi:hypothetical protein
MDRLVLAMFPASNGGVLFRRRKRWAVFVGPPYVFQRIAMTSSTAESAAGRKPLHNRRILARGYSMVRERYVPPGAAAPHFHAGVDLDQCQINPDALR